MDPKQESAGASFFDWATLTPRDAFTVLRTAPKVLGPWSDLGQDHRTGDAVCRRSVDGQVVARLWVARLWWHYSIPGLPIVRTHGNQAHAQAAADTDLRSDGWLLVDDETPTDGDRAALTPQRRFDRERMRVRALGRALHRATSQGDFFLDIHRAAGGCVCDECGFAYDDHPNFDPACPTLVVLCDGTYVKL